MSTAMKTRFGPEYQSSTDDSPRDSSENASEFSLSKSEKLSNKQLPTIDRPLSISKHAPSSTTSSPLALTRISSATSPSSSSSSFSSASSIFLLNKSSSSCAMLRPSQLVVTNEAIYVVDQDLHCVHIFSSTDGRHLRSFGSEGSGAGQFRFPRGIAISPATSISESPYISSSELFVSDTLNDRIQVFSLDGRFIRSWGSRGSENGSFNWPHHLAIAGNKIYVTDSHNCRVQVFDWRTGEFLRSFGSEGKEHGQFMFPYGIAVVLQENEMQTDSEHAHKLSEDAGLVFVGDDELHRISVFTLHGKYVASFGHKHSSALFSLFRKGDDDLNEPRGLFACNGRLFVCDSQEKRIKVFGYDGKLLGKWNCQAKCRGVSVVSGVAYVTVAEDQHAMQGVEIFQLKEKK